MTDIRASMKLGATTEAVQVTADSAPIVESASTVLATTIDTKQVLNLPIQGRNVFKLAFQSPGWASVPLGIVSQTTLAIGAVQQGVSVADIQSLTFGQTTGGPTRPRVVASTSNGRVGLRPAPSFSASSAASTVRTFPPSPSLCDLSASSASPR